MKKSILLFIALLFLFSCSVQYEKRRYSKGYFVHFSEKKKIKPAKSSHIAEKKQRDSFIKASSAPEFTTNVGPALGEEAIQKQQKKSINDPMYTASVKPVHVHRIIPKQLLIEKTKKEHQSYFRAVNKDKKNTQTSDKYMYWLAAAIGLGSFGLVRASKSTTLKLTRWSNKNKKKTRALIALSQIGILVLGVLTGKNLYALGYTTSNWMDHFFDGATLLGFSVLFVNSWRKATDSFRSFYIKKIGFLVLAVSFFMGAIGIGNRLESKKAQISPMGYGIEKMHKHFSQPESQTNSNIKEKAETDNVGRGLLIALYVLLTIILIAAMIVATCAAICVVALGGELVYSILLVVFTVICLFAVMALVKEIKRLRNKMRESET